MPSTPTANPDHGIHPDKLRGLLTKVGIGWVVAGFVVSGWIPENLQAVALGSVPGVLLVVYLTYSRSYWARVDRFSPGKD